MTGSLGRISGVVQPPALALVCARCRHGRVDATLGIKEAAGTLAKAGAFTGWCARRSTDTTIRPASPTP